MRSNRSINNTASIILILILFTSMIVSAFCLIDTQRASGYALLFLLPLAYLIGVLIINPGIPEIPAKPALYELEPSS